MAAFGAQRANGAFVMRRKAGLFRCCAGALQDCNGLRERVLAAALVLFAACGAAVLAHMLIDLVGDVVLVRDAYDNAAHASRFIVLDTCIFGGFTLAWHLAAKAFTEARGGQRLLRRAAERIGSGPAWWFVLRVMLASAAILGLMGLVDVRLDAIRLEDVGDLFGGSSGLGLSISLGAGAGVGVLVRSAVRWIAVCDRAIVAVVIALLAALVRGAAIVAATRSWERPFSWHPAGGTLARRAGKRAPPLFV